jgi:hypothetical protein
MKTENLVEGTGEYDDLEKYKIVEGSAYIKEEPRKYIKFNSF